ncbi:MAG: NAD(P)-binding domain-containing protein [Microbacterium sp.]
MPDSATATATANIGVVGLAVMGSNLARNLASREGNTVAVYNRSRSKTDELIAEHPRGRVRADVQLRRVRGRAAVPPHRAHHGESRWPDPTR